MEVTRKLSLKAAQQVPWSSASLLHEKDGVRRAWPMLPCLAAVLLIGLLGLYVWPSGRSLLGEDPLKAWDPQVKAVGSAAVAYPKPKATSQKQVHIFVCTDEYDLRPLAVLINSTISNAMHPNRLHFHMVVPADRLFTREYLKSLFPNTHIEMASKFVDIHEVNKHITFRNDSGARKELISPYNFLPFYLPEVYKDIDRFIYLDSDIVVKGNIEELYNTDLEGNAAAAVEDCSQRFAIYFDFAQLAEIQAREGPDRPAWLPPEHFDPEACVFNRGVLVVNSKRWMEENITRAIIWWMDEFQKSKRNLYKAGLSQPPFLLALYGKHKVLDGMWNVRGLGRPNLSELEREYFFNMFSMNYTRKPFVSPFADTAHILHFNGAYKPWKGKRKRESTDDIISLCGRKERGLECAELWWEYLSPAANDFLKPFAKKDYSVEE
ncbi:unnamed protein product [Sphagnum jensenii]|uniref:Hexosyltransferase n=1 Tax=Sphagnum jensenii TaxID=128206 RepID=A0ABP1B9C9_9BRYO